MRWVLLLLLLAGCRWPAPTWDVAADADVARGAYLGEHVALCTTCHSPRDWRYYGGPLDPERRGAGGDEYATMFVLPPEVSMKGTNITPYALADWSDGELARAIHGGRNADGEALFLGMPYNVFRAMSQSDLEAVIAWLRTLPTVENDVPPHDWVWPFLASVVDSFPSPAVAPKRHPEPGTVANGRYIATLSSCSWCHSPIDGLGWPLPGKQWSGGQCFDVKQPGAGRVCSPNITPHETGIGTWTREAFVARFRGMTPDNVRKQQVAPGGFNSPMAWSAYAGLSEQDLSDLYDYLMTLPPKKSVVARWTPAAE